MFVFVCASVHVCCTSVLRSVIEYIVLSCGMHDVFEYVIKYPPRRGLTEECDTQAMAGLDINAPYRLCYFLVFECVQLYLYT